MILSIRGDSIRWASFLAIAHAYVELVSDVSETVSVSIINA
jgi:hypothetical protein